ncbi:alanine racemase [Prosthecobacter fusiformis]|uniref:Alanine racemase n=1 Tax=Prosthecobacter fusiformis TaxID=48464 RepID=A0A4R7RMQ3_9BACT|nr:alanine racemase [Prosthecobacter fusiformis]TDU66622.1 alanine racemase [Prosthecobacter fusiformis]
MNPEAVIFADEEVVRPTHVEVDLDCLAGNLAAIRAHVGPARVMAILKANAYGHGLVPVAQLMVRQGADYLGVAFLEEGILLRRAGIRIPILVLGGIAGEQIPLFLRHDLTLTAPSVEKLRLIDEAAAALGMQARVHLKVDTGMERIGIHYYNAHLLLEASLTCHHVQVEGIYSHFANADAADLAHARLQLQRFHEVLEFYPKRGLPMPMRHMANSAGILQLPESHLDLVRPGILLYGVYPAADCIRSVPVQAALTWKSRVAYFKVVQPGHPVSYGSTWQSDRPVRVITIPVGYGDGYFRALSNKAEVIVRGVRHPVVGRVCMDQMMVNLDQGTAYNGDEVILLGAGPGGGISADELASWAGTIPYEVLTNINTRVPRLYRGEA